MGGLADLFPGSSQVRLLGLAQADDRILLEHAKTNAFVLVTQDSDFSLLLRGERSAHRLELVKLVFAHNLWKTLLENEGEGKRAPEK